MSMRAALAAVLLCLSVSTASADVLFGPGDPILAIDRDAIILSGYPGPEGPGNVADQVSSTKYLNFFGAGTGFIVTPGFGASNIQSFQLTTANDFESRDPASYDLYGTNDPITSGDNSLGDQENWTLISSGGLSLPAARLAPGPIVDFANGVNYSSYKMIFPTLKGDPLMQVADVSLFTGASGSGAQVLGAGDPALAVTDNFGSESDYPSAEGPANAIDGTLDKYLNFGQTNSGFIVSRADGLATILESFTITTANDSPERDPSAWELYGTNDPVISGDNSTGDEENWTLVSSGALSLPDSRDTMGDEVLVANATAYGAYRLVFTGVKDAASANSMQIAEITMNGTIVPEPGALTLLTLGLAIVAGRRRA